MKNVLQGAAWASVLVLFAVAAHYELIDKAVAATMFAVIPALAIITMRGRYRCKTRVA